MFTRERTALFVGEIADLEDGLAAHPTNHMVGPTVRELEEVEAEQRAADPAFQGRDHGGG